MLNRILLKIFIQNYSMSEMILTGGEKYIELDILLSS